MSSRVETRFGDVTAEQTRRLGAPASTRPVYGVDRSQGLTSQAKYVSGDLSRYKRLEPGMFAYNPMRLNIGSIGFCDSERTPGLVSSDYIVFSCRDDVLLPEYLRYYVLGPSWAQWTSSAGVGSVRSRIYYRELAMMPVSLPTIAEQRHVVQILRTLDDKIELNRNMNRTLESIARAIFESWFVDRDSSDGTTEHNSAERWPKVAFSETVQVLSGGTPRTSEPEFWGGGLPWYSVADAPSAGDVFVTDTEKTISSAGVESSAAQLVPDLTTIVSARGTVGKCALTGREMAFNQSCYGLRPMDQVGYYFTYFSTRNLVEELRRSAHGSVFSTITRDTLSTVCVHRPPSGLVAAFEREVGPLMQRILVAVEHSRALTLTRDALLPRLVSGDLAAAGATGLSPIGRH